MIFPAIAVPYLEDDAYRWELMVSEISNARLCFPYRLTLNQEDKMTFTMQRYFYSGPSECITA